MARDRLAEVMIFYHVAPREELMWDADDRYQAKSLATDGFIHCSYRERVLESAHLYFPAGADLVVLEIDPGQLDVPVDVAPTPRGPMPHVLGSIPRRATTLLTLADLADNAGP